MKRKPQNRTHHLTSLNLLQEDLRGQASNVYPNFVVNLIYAMPQRVQALIFPVGEDIS